MLSTEQVIRRGQMRDRVFSILGVALTILCLGVLAILLVNLCREGLARIDWQFLTTFPSRRAAKAGIFSAWVGSALVMLVTGLTAIPLGVAAGVYLEEYGRRNWFTSLIEINIANLAGVPSIIYGLMALGLLIYKWEDWFGDKTDSIAGLGQSIITGGLTLAFLILPIVIVATREALRAIPQHMREAAYALGASRWQVVKDHLLPYSTGGISTGVIIALSRAIGETAPLVTIGALTYIAFLPPAPFSHTESGQMVGPFAWLSSPFTVLPIQMFNWVSRPSSDDNNFAVNAAAAGIILMLVTLTMNTVAIVIRARVRKKVKW
ncbi:Phosphate transport system permease protein PstA [Phycisphaerales bacterium]|nr:Phosphate transport system permease protein PstA [Phycisphaerales bacterium]